MLHGTWCGSPSLCARGQSRVFARIVFRTFKFPGCAFPGCIFPSGAFQPGTCRPCVFPGGIFPRGICRRGVFPRGDFPRSDSPRGDSPRGGRLRRDLLVRGFPSGTSQSGASLTGALQNRRHRDGTIWRCARELLPMPQMPSRRRCGSRVVRPLSRLRSARSRPGWWSAVPLSGYPAPRVMPGWTPRACSQRLPSRKRRRHSSQPRAHHQLPTLISHHLSRKPPSLQLGQGAPSSVARLSSVRGHRERVCFSTDGAWARRRWC